jgi:CTP:molybdopterin cytidylyltransferase MocA
VDGAGTAETDADLILQALGDLPDVARRHHAKIVGTPRACITEGKRVQGSGGHAHVVVIEAPATAAPVRAYHH